jgi:hypothetical protein
MDAFGAFFLFAILAAIIALVVAVARGRAKLRGPDDVEGRLGLLILPGMMLRFTATELIEGYGEQATRYPLAGLTARVEDAGELNRRITATRIVALGVFALAAPKTKDTRTLFLTVEGPETAIMKALPLKGSLGSMPVKVRQFVFDLNHAAEKIAA